MQPKIATVGVLALALLAATLASGQPVENPPSTGSAPSQDAITPAHVHQRVEWLRRELELIRQRMGEQEFGGPTIQVLNAQPREVYFQAATLFAKADRLAFDHTRERATPPERPAGQLQPAAVFEMVDAARGRILRVAQSLGIRERPATPPLDETKEPSDVFAAIVLANRDLNLLLEEPFTPGDVFRQVTVAIAYAARLLDTPVAISTPPLPPPLEPGKTPPDVFTRLVGCYEKVQTLGGETGTPMLELVVSDEMLEQAVPSDVYDIASLMVSELAQLHAQKDGAKAPREAHDPGSKVPSDVYQRTEILCDQLDALLKQLPQTSSE